VRELRPDRTLVTFARDPVLEIDAALLDEGVPLGHYRFWRNWARAAWARCGAPGIS
jgi:hypothetical protein